MMNRLLIVLLALLIQACVSSAPPPETFYYVLEEKPLTYEWEDSDKEVMVKIVEIPSYLLQPNLVMLENSHQLYYANYHKWANDLKENTLHVLLADLNTLATDTNFVKSCKGCDALLIHVHSFYPTDSGEVYLHGFVEVDYRDVSGVGEKRAQRHSFALTTPVKTADYQGAVSAMRASVELLSQAIYRHYGKK